MTVFKTLSAMDQEKVKHDTSVALLAMFAAMHEANGWCGDMMPEHWNAAYPILLEAMARNYRPQKVA